MDAREDDGRLTLRIPRSAVALLGAVVAHALLTCAALLLPVVKPVEHPITIELASRAPPPPPAPPPASAPPATPKPRKIAKVTPPPSTSPVQPSLPPSSEGVPVPFAPPSPEPAPPPEPTTWKDKLLAQLAATRPPTARLPTGPLAPNLAALERVALSDARLHDDDNERRLAEDYGPFFRRGLEQLRSNWHPDEVLNQNERDPAKRCGHTERTTFAVAVLDRGGNVVDVDLRNPSGCPDLDAEAIAAFKRVAQFPHPPQGLFVDGDGQPVQTARYPVRFIVTFSGGLRLLPAW